MKTIENFINDFISAEYEALKGKWDISISNEECGVLNVKAKSYFHSLLSSMDFGRVENFFEDEDILDYAPMKLEELQKRTLFQIKEYKNPVCGERIKQALVDNTIFLCYAGDVEVDDDSKAFYSRIFVLANSDENLKIISYFRFKEGELEQLDNYESNQITDLGILVNVKKLQAPEEENSLADYNAE